MPAKVKAGLEAPGVNRSHASPWHLITPEYPPQAGGVSDYTRLLAHALAEAGEEVQVWCPSSDRAPESDSRVEVRYELGRMRPADLFLLGAALDQLPKPRRLLLQWVPHGFGYRSMNLPFCLWILARSALRRDEVEIMVHEPFLVFGEGTWKQDLAALVHRVMTAVLLQATRCVWVSTPMWSEALKPFALGRRISFRWLPIPSNIPVVGDRAATLAVRKRLDCGGPLFGHFGTYGRVITTLLREMIPSVLNALPTATMVLVGPGGERFRTELVQTCPEIGSRLSATGYLDFYDVSTYISACDVMVQPYPDGVTTRRTSVMAALAHSRATITTSGRLTEPFWARSEAVNLHPVGDLPSFLEAARRLSEDEAQRNLLGTRAHALYAECFDIKNTVTALGRSRQGI